MKMTTKEIVDYCNNACCVLCEWYNDKYRNYPTYKDDKHVREMLKMPDSAYSESEVIEL